jgi:hypothetical protein
VLGEHQQGRSHHLWNLCARLFEPGHQLTQPLRGHDPTTSGADASTGSRIRYLRHPCVYRKPHPS